MSHKTFGLALAVLLGLNFGLAVAQTSASQPTDLGAAPPSERLERMVLLLAPSPDQRQALAAELEAQQNPGSPAYHHWLTPQAFADAYSRSPEEVATVAAWLRAQGFDVAPLPASRGWIEFSGTVTAVEQAFHTEVHTVATASGERAAAIGDFTLPSALKPLVKGLVSLDGVVSAPALAAALPVKATAAELAAETVIAKAEALTPKLAGTLLNLDALHAAGISGAGESIAIAARSNVRREDVAAFRAAFGLPESPLEVTLTGAEPGRNDDEAEAVMAASWGGAAAPAARIVLVPTATTSATDGLDLSLAYIVDHSLAHTVAVGYTACESALSEAHREFYAAIYRQAAAEGMEVIAASGDSGPAACHAAGSDALVSTGYGVNVLASTPWNTAVGVAAFSAADGSALAAWSPVNTGDPGYAGGGGRSTLYAAPEWQPLPSASLQEASGSQHRLLPDLALPSAIDSGVNRGLAFCMSGEKAAWGCTLVRAGGSSAAAALFAGIAALVAQKNGPQGNLAPHLYELSRQSGIFTDIQEGSTKLPCASASPDCDTTGHIGFAAGAGYDLATGLGIADAHALVTRWAVTPAVGTGKDTVTITNGGQTINPSALTTITAQIASDTGGATPTGTVLFYDTTSSKNLSNTASIVEADGTASLSIEGGFALGHNAIEAKYSGDATYKANTSPTADIFVTKGTTSAAVTPSTYSPGVGATISVTAAITVTNFPGNDPPTGTIQMQLDGVTKSTLPVKIVSGTPQATFSIKIPTAGGHTLQAIYSGDANYVTSTSPAITVTASASTDTVTITNGGQTINPSALTTISAQISSSSGGAQPTGTVLFYDTTNSKNLSNTPSTVEADGTAALSIEGGFVLGHNAIEAKYSGDQTYPANTSSPADIYVTKGNTSLAVTPSTYAPGVGATISVVAQITVTNFPGNTPPGGTILIQLDGVTKSTQPVTIVSGTAQATFSVKIPTAGGHTLQSIYSGDANYVTSTSTAVTVTASTSTDTVTITTSGSTINPSALITISAQVSSNSGGAQPTGTVLFYDTTNGKNLSNTPSVVESGGTASLSIEGGFALGNNNIVAKYSGDSTYPANSSGAVDFFVTPGDTSLAVTPSTYSPAVGVAFTATAAITVTNFPGNDPPTGTIQLQLDGKSYATKTVTIVNGTAEVAFAVTVSATGVHTLQAIYSGDANYVTSTSPAVSVTAGASSANATVTTLTASPAVLTAGVPETFTATIAPAAGTSTTPITGTVKFYDGTTLLGTTAVASDVATLPGIALSATATHSITAVYSGDSNWATSTSSALTLVAAVLFSDTVTLSATSGSLAPGQVVTLTATVTPTTVPPAGDEQNPTGNVIFYDGTTVLGTVALVPATGDTSRATLVAAKLPAGQDVITAVYVGDTTFKPGTSNALTIDVENFTITPAPGNPLTNLTIVKGSSGSAAFIVTGQGGFKGQVSVVCATEAQDDMTCTASPQVVTPTATVTFVVQTYSTGTVPPTTSRANHGPLWPGAASGTALAVLGFFLLPIGRRTRIFASRSTRRFCILLLLLVGLGGAGIGCTSFNLSSGPGTPLGVATLKITAAAYINDTVVSQSTYLTVNVVPKS